MIAADPVLADPPAPEPEPSLIEIIALLGQGLKAGTLTAADAMIRLMGAGSPPEAEPEDTGDEHPPD